MEQMILLVLLEQLVQMVQQLVQQQLLHQLKLQIYLLMLTNKIVSAGIEEDEEATYKEKEEEAVRRVVEA